MKTPRNLSLVIIIGFLLAIIVSIFAHLYVVTRRERVLTAICIPVTVGDTHVHFAVPSAHYVGWFSKSPDMHKNIWEPHSKPAGIDFVKVTIGTNAQSLEVDDYGSFRFDVHPEDEFQSSELVVGSESSNQVWYLNLRSAM